VGTAPGGGTGKQKPKAKKKKRTPPEQGKDALKMPKKKPLFRQTAGGEGPKQRKPVGIKKRRNKNRVNPPSSMTEDTLCPFGGVFKNRGKEKHPNKNHKPATTSKGLAKKKGGTGFLKGGKSTGPIGGGTGFGNPRGGGPPSPSGFSSRGWSGENHTTQREKNNLTRALGGRGAEKEELYTETRKAG